MHSAPRDMKKEAVDVIESSLAGLAAHRDSMQNLYVSLPQNVGGRPLVMLDAHTDEVGFMVQSITATGLLRIVPLGGWVEHNIPAHTFLLHNKRGETVRAVSTSKPPHFMTAAERSARFRWRASCWTPECAAAKTPQSCLIGTRPCCGTRRAVQLQRRHRFNARQSF